MPKVCFLIPASPTEGFFAQIAAFQISLGKLAWGRWEPSILVCLGGTPDRAALEKWQPQLPDVALFFVPHSDSASNPFYYAQIDGLFRYAPLDADMYVRVDADTLPVGDLADLLDHVATTSSIAGVMAHFTFPIWPGTTSREAWGRIAEGLISQPLDFRYAYSLTDWSAADDNRVTPFYLNDGVVFFPKSLFGEFSQLYLALRPLLMEKLPYPYFSGQIALALAVAEMRASTCALPMRYNFPNDELAEKKFPEELENVKVFHYLRDEHFDRQAIFTSAARYDEFLEPPLQGSNRVFQQSVRRILGDEYPFLQSPPVP